MDEAKQTSPDAGADTGGQTAARQEEATSSDTLSDLRQTQTDSAAPPQGGTSESSGASSAPSPDGTPDTAARGGTADGRDSGGPM